MFWESERIPKTSRSPADGAVLTTALHNGQPVTITHTASGQTAATGNLTVEFPSKTLTINVTGNGATNPAAGTHSCREGSEVTITATAAAGSRFVGWTGDVAGASINGASITVTMDADKTIVAVFAQEVGSIEYVSHQLLALIQLM